MGQPLLYEKSMHNDFLASIFDARLFVLFLISFMLALAVFSQYKLNAQ